MTMNRYLNLRLRSVVIGVLASIAMGGAGTYIFLRSADAPRFGSRFEMVSAPGSGSATTAPATPPPSDGPRPDLVVALSDEAVKRAGVSVSTVVAGLAAEGLRLPGIIEPNAYRQVVVTPLVGGRITSVLAELGQKVRRGETMAKVFSPELAEAHTRFATVRAELEAHERELQRTEKLVQIGAASRQELERIHAEHTAKTAEVQSARSRLELLGAPASAFDVAASEARASVDVPAPIDGVVTERLANVGLNVELASKLFTVVDLSTVWVVADLYEKDFSSVRVGSFATATTSAYPDVAISGRVSYIDPQVSAQTRTAKLRVEVKNPKGELRLGMYADVHVAGGGSVPAPRPLVPSSAIQTVGDRQVVYLVDPKQPGRFTEREVRLGRATGGQADVLSGVVPGDVVVTEGSFFVRAEIERLGLRSSAPSGFGGGQSSAGQDSHNRQAAVAVQTATVVVGERGYEPAELNLRAGIPARVTFIRTTDKTCGTEVVFPSLNIKRALPLNEPVVVEFTAAKTGDIAFACGMNMLRGTVIVD